MERSYLESAAVHVTYLRGLLGVPLGLLFIFAAFTNLGWGPFREPWLFVPAVAVLGAGGLVITLYYRDNYGRVTLATARQAGYTVASLVLGATIIGGSILDFALEPPVSVFAVTFALAMLAWFAYSVGLRAHHLVVWGAVVVVGLMPVWGGLDDSVSVACLPIGAAIIAAGIFDHLTLVRTFGPAKDTRVGT